VLSLSETPVAGRDAQFTVSVDGVQLGGVQTVTALRGSGQAQDFTFQGNFGSGPHTVSLVLTNGYAGDPADIGRALYVNAITFDRQTTFANATDLYRNPLNYTVQAPATPKASNAGTQDTLVLNVSEANPDGGDALFMVSVDGQVVGGLQTVTAQHGAGQSQNIALTGAFGPGSHAVAVDFVNGYDGAPANAHRLLYVNSITLDGQATVVNDAIQYVGAHQYAVQSGWVV
jgi:hypothetical protein